MSPIKTQRSEKAVRLLSSRGEPSTYEDTPKAAAESSSKPSLLPPRPGPPKNKAHQAKLEQQAK